MIKPPAREFYMKMEIERKFLVTGEDWRAAAGDGRMCEQGYISSGPSGATVRVRRIAEQGFLTLKGPSMGISRPEFEYEIPVEDAEALLNSLCGGRIVSKMRYTFICKGMQWEVDEFSGDNQGLILAEIELNAENQVFEKPDWVGEEVSDDPRYFNASHARNPYRTWEL
jgi:CYTH domain-containing protein